MLPFNEHVSRCICITFFLLCITKLALCENKYSKEANTNINTLQKPFRMQKLNLLWQKAVKQLDEKKLKNLYNDFINQDKEELALKRFKSEGQDKDGLKEAHIRRQLGLIMRKYSLDWTEPNSPTNTQSDYGLNEKALFKDKKLDKLFQKAQRANFNEQQLKILKDELRHYEEKMDQYHQLISDLSDKEAQIKIRQEQTANHVDTFLEAEQNDTQTETKQSVEQMQQKLQEKHLMLKEEYRRLTDTVHNASIGNEPAALQYFDEERVGKLWNLALKSDFTVEELDSLRDELLHFQKRIQKLKFFQAQLESDRMIGKESNYHEEMSHQKHVVNKVNELNHVVEKMHAEIENRILQRHSEL